MRAATGEADNYAVHGQLWQMSGTQEDCCDWLHASWQLGQVVHIITITVWRFEERGIS